MPIVQIVVWLLVMGLIWWLFSTYVLPYVPDPFRTTIIVVLVVALCLWLLSWVGIIGPMDWRLSR